MAGSVGQGQRRGLEGVERSQAGAGFLAGDWCRRRNIWLRRAEFRLTGFHLDGFRFAGFQLDGFRFAGFQLDGFRLRRASGSPGSGWGDADWEKLWGTNDFPQRVSSGSGFPVALLDGDDAEVSSSEDTTGARIVHHDLLLSSGGFFAREVRVPDASSASGGRSDADTGDTAEVAPEKEVLVRRTRASLSRQTESVDDTEVLVRRTRASLSRQTRSVDDTEPLRAKLGEDTRINEEGLLTPDDVTLGSWIQSATDYSGTLQLIVRLLDDESGDALFLEAGYDTTKVTSVPQWDDTTKELPVNIASGATPTDIRNALSFLSLRTDPASADSERKVWLFPTLSEVDSFRHRVDETAGLVRYYLYDDTVRSRADATTAAAGRSLFGKPGYLGMPLTTEGKNIYKSLGSSASNLHLAISKSGRSWRITAGPRTGQEFWNVGRTLRPGRVLGQGYGSGADGSGWSSQFHFWENSFVPGGSHSYAVQDGSGRPATYSGSRSGRSISHHDFLLSDRTLIERPVSFEELLPNPELKVDFSMTWAEPNRHLLLTEDHLSVKDPDTVLSPGVVDPAKITLRVMGISGGTLQSRTSASADWVEMTKVVSEDYYAFTLADLKAGKIAFLAGDGKKIVFKVQAADDGLPETPGSPSHLSDSDPSTTDPDPVDGEILIIESAKTTAGDSTLLNEDGVLTPNDVTLGSWIQSATDYSDTLHVVVKLVGKQDGDVLSLRSGYDESNITPDWKKSVGELWLEIGSGVTEAEIQAALKLLELQTVLAASASVRQVWVYPILPRVHYRMDTSAGLMRYYLYDDTRRRFAAASTKASERILFGKDGYLGVYTSDAEREIYQKIHVAFVRWGHIHLAISDDSSAGTTEGKWVIMAGPRKGQLFWDDTESKYGPGAAGSGWSEQTDFWDSGEPDNEYGRGNYATSEYGSSASDYNDLPRNSVSHHDFWLSAEEISMRPVVVGKSPPNPILEVDFSWTRADPGQRLVLTEKHILVKDVDTVLDDGTLDASKITLRVSGLQGGSLELLDSSSGNWVSIKKTVVNGGSPDYYAFTLADLEAGKIGLLVGDGVARANGGDGTKVAFQIQAADDGMPGDLASDPNLSDFDPLTPDKDPVGGDIVIVTAAKATAGFRELLNADGVLTPNAAILRAWKQSASAYGGTLGLIVRLLDRQTGDALSLRGGYETSKVAPRWDASTGELSLEFDAAATTSEMKTALELLELDTEVAGSVSTRKVWIFPILSGVSGFGYRVDKTAGLLRYYLYDSQDRSFATASTAASGRSLFGKSGYLGVFTSDAERDIYNALVPSSVYVRLAISDSDTEGKWVITAGPRKGQIFWDHTANPKVYGPGAEGSGWTKQNDFWYGANPDNINDQDYASMRPDGLVGDDDDGSRRFVSHHDLWLQAGDIFSRPVEVAESPPNPVLRVDFDGSQATAQRPLILTQDHISVDDLDTRDVNKNVDADKIKFRITGLRTEAHCKDALRARQATGRDIVADGAVPGVHSCAVAGEVGFSFAQRRRYAQLRYPSA